MLRSMYSGISGLKVNQTKNDVTANNIANATTTAFKASNARFTDMLYQSSGGATGATTTVGGTNGMQVGLGAKVSSINKIMSQGNMLTTNRNEDMMIDGPGYFIVAKGKVDGEITVDAATHKMSSADDADKKMSDVSFTRDGNFQRDEAGNLVTASGYRIMGYRIDGATYTAVDKSGGTSGDLVGMKITGAPDAQGAKAVEGKIQPIQIPYQVNGEDVSGFAIGSDGLITVTLAGGSKVAIGQIAMAGFSNPEGLKDVGGNFAQESTNSGVAFVRCAKGTTSDDNNGAFGKMYNDRLESSNVDLTEQFTEMITATRAFQASAKLISNGSEILQTIVNLVN